MAGPALRFVLDPRERAEAHALLRYAVGVTGSFVLCSALDWQPAFLAPVLTSVLIANLPMRPPLKLAVVIVASLALSGLLMVMLSLTLYHFPLVLFGIVALCTFVVFHWMLTGGPGLPLLLSMIAIGIVPMMTIASPQHAGTVPLMLLRGIGTAMLTVWVVYAIWPTPPPPKAVAKADVDTEPLATALAATIALVPLILAYLLLTPTHAVPALMGVIIIVSQFQLQRSRWRARAYVVGNIIGGLIGVLAFWLLTLWPSLFTLGVLTFLAALIPGSRIATGADNAMAASIAGIGMLIIFGSSIQDGPASPELWVERVLYYCFAGLFALGAMELLWPLLRKAAPSAPAPAAGPST
jgi:hypothetical protein